MAKEKKNQEPIPEEVPAQAGEAEEQVQDLSLIHI